MRLILGMATGWVLATVLLLPSAARGQEASAETQAGPVALAMQTADENADREVLSRFLAREDVQRVAGMADVDLDRASAGVMALDGERLSRAADQARALETRLGAADTITLSATTIIIVLLLVLLIIVAAS